MPVKLTLRVDTHGFTHWMEYDGGQVTLEAVGDAGTPELSRTWQYDLAGRLTK